MVCLPHLADSPPSLIAGVPPTVSFAYSDILHTSAVELNVITIHCAESAIPPFDFEGE